MLLTGYQIGNHSTQLQLHSQNANEDLQFSKLFITAPHMFLSCTKACECYLRVPWSHTLSQVWIPSAARSTTPLAGCELLVVFNGRVFCLAWAEFVVPVSQFVSIASQVQMAALLSFTHCEVSHQCFKLKFAILNGLTAEM